MKASFLSIFQVIEKLYGNAIQDILLRSFELSLCFDLSLCSKRFQFPIFLPEVSLGSGESGWQEASSFHRVRPVRQKLIPETSGVLDHGEKLPDSHETSDRQQGWVDQLPSSTVISGPSSGPKDAPSEPTSPSR